MVGNGAPRHNCTPSIAALFLRRFLIRLNAMTNRPIRQIFVLLLAAFVTGGMGLSAVQANGMAVKMALSSDMGSSGHDGCAGCPEGDGDSGKNATACIAVCLAPVLAVLPAVAPMVFTQIEPAFLVRTPVLQGRALPTEPYPPRTTDIG
jgi:hypothetical protein